MRLAILQDEKGFTKSIEVSVFTDKFIWRVEKPQTVLGSDLNPISKNKETTVQNSIVQEILFEKIESSLAKVGDIEVLYYKEIKRI